MGISDDKIGRDIDLLDPATHQRAVPHQVYRALREQEPVSFHRSAYAGPDDPGFWLLTRHADVHSALIDTSSYSSYRGGTNLLNDPPEQLELSRLMLINMDPPGHTRYRRLISRSFASRAVERMEPQVRELCQRVIDRLAGRTECDFVTDVASQVPMQVIFMLLGVPEADWAQLVHQTEVMMNQGNSEAAMAASLGLYMYADQLASRRTQEPGEDMASQLLCAEVNGERLTQAEFNAFFFLLVVAGNETTRNLISSGMMALLEHPEQLARLRSEPELIPSAVEEMLRYVSPVTEFRRTANRDIELHGKLLREGDRVILVHASANRDERVFADPDRFDITRSPNPHLAFGVGAHLCVGASLARLEARCMFDEILRRLVEIEVCGPALRMNSALVNGYQTMPVRYRIK
jgi:cytochrome P450